MSCPNKCLSFFESNYKLKVITSYFSDCSGRSALIEDMLTVECKIGGNKVDTVYEMNPDANFHNGFIMKDESHVIFHT